MFHIMIRPNGEILNNSIKILITARAGSRRIKNKNLVLFNGAPLIFPTFLAAKESNLTHEIYVSTDCPKISELAQQNKIFTISRPKHLALDTTSSDAVIEHFINKVCAPKDVIILLQPTSPLRDHHDVRKAYNIFLESKDTVISVFKPIHHPLKSVILRDNKCSPWGEFIGNEREQDLPEVLSFNGAIYVFTAAEFMKKNTIPKEFTPYIMPYLKSIDINEANDLKIAQIFSRYEL